MPRRKKGLSVTDNQSSDDEEDDDPANAEGSDEDWYSDDSTVEYKK